MTTGRKRSGPEAAILKAVAEFLTIKGFYVERRNIQGTRILSRTRKADGKTVEYAIKTGRAGQADLYGWHRFTGRHIEVEVKAPGNVPTPAQREWLVHCKNMNAIAFWCDSVDSAARALDALGID